jgi:hypothetical protein
MTTIWCTRCGATVTATRTRRNSNSVSYSNDFILNCIQLRERLAATEDDKEPTKCSDMDAAVSMAVAAGRI